MMLSLVEQTRQAAAVLGRDSQKLVDLATRLDGIATRLETFHISSDDAEQRVNELLAGAKLAMRQLVSDKAEFKLPILTRGREIDEAFRPCMDAFEKIKELASQKLQARIEADALIAAAKMAALDAVKTAQLEAIESMSAATTAAERLAAEAQLDSATKTLVQSKDQIEERTSVKSEHATSSLRYKLTPRLVDITLLPRQLLERACLLGARLRPETDVLQRVLQEEIAADEKVAIPGVEIYRKPILSTRLA
jgi:hypothetical protein